MKTKCLIIDDHLLFNDGLALILNKSDKFEVLEQVFDSRQAYLKCMSNIPELIIVDYNMPYLTGLEVVSQLKTLNYTPKIVIVSMYADQREIEQFEKLGVHGFFPKTIPSQQLIGRLIQIMNGENHFEFNKKEAILNDHFYIKNQLTKREIDVLKILKKGFTTEQIAEELGLSFYTIETHRKNINQKMKFSTKKEFYDFLNIIPD